MNANEYTYLIIKYESDHIGLVVEFPSLVFRAPDSNTAHNGVVELVTETLAEIEKNHDIPPRPTRMRAVNLTKCHSCDYVGKLTRSKRDLTVNLPLPILVKKCTVHTCPSCKTELYYYGDLDKIATLLKPAI